jgi:HTH-type transcriptional regulator/antitoxin HigA
MIAENQLYNLPNEETVVLQNQIEHKAALKEFRVLSRDEEANYDRLVILRDAIHAFEESSGHNPGPPQTVAGFLEVEMFKRRLKQKQLAQLLGIAESRLSEVIRHKRSANSDLLRRIHKHLNVPAEEVLELVD